MAFSSQSPDLILSDQIHVKVNLTSDETFLRLKEKPAKIKD